MVVRQASFAVVAATLGAIGGCDRGLQHQADRVESLMRQLKDADSDLNFILDYAGFARTKTP